MASVLLHLVIPRLAESIFHCSSKYRCNMGSRCWNYLHTPNPLPRSVLVRFIDFSTSSTQKVILTSLKLCGAYEPSTCWTAFLHTSPSSNPEFVIWDSSLGLPAFRDKAGDHQEGDFLTIAPHFRNSPSMKVNQASLSKSFWYQGKEFTFIFPGLLKSH